MTFHLEPVQFQEIYHHVTVTWYLVISIFLPVSAGISAMDRAYHQVNMKAQVELVIQTPIRSEVQLPSQTSPYVHMNVS